MLLTKNEIKAVRKLVFTVIRKTMKIGRMQTEFDACSVDLSSVLVWAIREQCLLSSDQENMEFNIKLDGRPLGGMVHNSIYHFYFILFTQTLDSSTPQSNLNENKKKLVNSRTLTVHMQTCQLSRFHRETHGLGYQLTVSRFGLQVSR